MDDRSERMCICHEHRHVCGCIEEEEERHRRRIMLMQMQGDVERSERRIMILWGVACTLAAVAMVIGCL